MQAPFVILTGASGSGKTTVAQLFAEKYSHECEVFFFDSIGVPSVEEMLAQYGGGHQPGGAWQRAMTFHWIERAAAILATGRPVLLEGQIRIAFILEALATHGLTAHIVLVDCDDQTRTERLHGERNQPDLANEQMMGWARYLREEAIAAHCEILETTTLSPNKSVARLHALLLA
jgi:dephospho-CoA kinase